MSVAKTNWFKVKDRKAWEGFLSRLCICGSQKPYSMTNDDGEVAFYAYGEIYGLNTEAVAEEDVAKLKEALCKESQVTIENFLDRSVEDKTDEEIESLISETLAAMHPYRLRDHMNEYDIGTSDHEGMRAMMIKGIQELLEPGGACVIMQVSDDEGIASAQAITKDTDTYMDFETMVAAQAAQMVGNPGYKLRMIE